MIYIILGGLIGFAVYKTISRHNQLRVGDNVVFTQNNISRQGKVSTIYGDGPRDLIAIDSDHGLYYVKRSACKRA